MAKPESTVETNENRMIIDVALMENLETITSIANRYGATRSALSRYKSSLAFKERCMNGLNKLLNAWMVEVKHEAGISAERIANAKSRVNFVTPQKQVEQNNVITIHDNDKKATSIACNSDLSLQDRIRLLMDNAELVLSNADDNGELKLKAIKELRETIKLLAQLNGELNTGSNIQINIDRQIGDTSEIIINSLEAFPEAKEHVMLQLAGNA